MAWPFSSSSSSSFLINLHTQFLFCFFFFFSSAQQPYINNHQNNCYAINSSVLGYTCNGDESCSSFLTFRAKSPNVSIDLISSLLGTDARNTSRLNSIAEASPIDADRIIVIPIRCSCSGRFYQYNSSYTIRAHFESYFTIANDTFQGLSTCQALLDQNPFDSHSLAVGTKLVVPLRCACPTRNQSSAGIKHQVSYLIAPGDNIPTIAKLFGADFKLILAANELNQKSPIYPFTTLLIPISSEQAKISIPLSSPSVSETFDSSSHSSGGFNHVGLFIGFAIVVALLLGVALRVFFWLRRKPMQKEPLSRFRDCCELPTFKKSTKTTMKSFWLSTAPVLTPNIREMLDCMSEYTFEELQNSTGNFDEEHRITGSVYRGKINGDDVAIKIMEGCSSDEIKTIKHISHSNLIKLLGFCLQKESTFVVYEFAERGSVSDWLQHKKNRYDSPCLSWKQRIQIACDVADGLNYLHNYANPPFIHKNLNSSNVLLGKDFRAKITNLGFTRPMKKGYIAPEYISHETITPKLDVFAFGVLLLELLSGREAIFIAPDEFEGEVFLWQEIDTVLQGEDTKNRLRGFVDPCLNDEYRFDLAFAMAELAKRCLSPDADSRPAMEEFRLSLAVIYNSTLVSDLQAGTISYSDYMIHGR